MSTTNILILGLIAGITIFIGLPIGRMRSSSHMLRSALSAVTIGVLVFLLWDVLTHAVEPVDSALTAAAIAKTQSWWPFIGLATAFFVALIVGLLSLVAYDNRIARQADLLAAAVKGPADHGILRLHDPASRLAFLIAVGIGLHNFSEGLAIGQSAAGGQISLAFVLVIGFGLHNATEGFGITGPLAGSDHRPSWGQLGILGLIGGGPTLVGTLLGSVWVNDVVSLVFLALAAGSILYVIIQLLGVALRQRKDYTLYAGMLLGIVAGFTTDFIVSAAGA